MGIFDKLFGKKDDAVVADTASDAVAPATDMSTPAPAAEPATEAPADMASESATVGYEAAAEGGEDEEEPMA